MLLLENKMKHEQLSLSIAILRHFIDGSLGTSRESHAVTGFELSESLLDAAAYNTYVETVGNKADTLYLRLKEGITEMPTYAYLDYISRLSKKFNWLEKEFILAFDYTDEDFYGEVQGFDIHGWTKDHGVTGKFKFLTCSIVSDDIPERIPLISIPIQLGHYKSYAINYCITQIKKYVGKIKLILFDRGFYDKDLMYELSNADYKYLIFVPKTKDKKELLYPLKIGEKIAIYNEFTINKDKTKYDCENVLIFLKEIYDKKSEKNYNWVFATNTEELELSEIIQTYKKRWRIETGFRVQDEAKIECKSTDMKIRYFIFLFEQILQTQWVCFYKEEATFKKFIIEMHTTCKDLVANPNKKFNG